MPTGSATVRSFPLWGLSLVFAAVFLASLGLGRFSIPPDLVVRALIGKSVYPDVPDSVTNVVLNVRLPRVIGASLVGASLALAGACFQGLFKNPLVSPGILGVSQGAGTGAALAILLGLGSIWINIFAIAFGIIAVTCAYLIALFYRSSSPLILILGGIIVGGFFSSLISLMTFAANPYDTLPNIVYWLMGSLAGISYVNIYMVALPVVTCTAALLSLRWRLNVMSLGNREAESLGIDTGKMTRIIIVCATCITASAVCISGTIGWIGLVVPHLARLLVGVDHDRLLPASALLGATVLILIDDMARTLTGVEIPIGILTGIFGAPFFTFLLFRQRRALA